MLIKIPSLFSASRDSRQEILKLKGTINGYLDAVKTSALKVDKYVISFQYPLNL